MQFVRGSTATLCRRKQSGRDSQDRDSRAGGAGQEDRERQRQQDREAGQEEQREWQREQEAAGCEELGFDRFCVLGEVWFGDARAHRPVPLAVDSRPATGS